MIQVARKDWEVRSVAGVRGGRGVTKYVARYLRGGPVKDQRLVSADDHKVTFRYRDHRDGKEKLIALTTEHFMSRVLWHVPVKGQHHVRYYGLYAPGAGAKRERIRE